ncbi:MAG: DNA-binding protein [Leptolyngbyaceae cyanobacterium RM1_406_9]|nr:DNA-binding protein [Leptolyngbyaceae cyanobacterium RM1_406_9]
MRRVAATASIIIDLPDNQFQKLQELAELHGIPPESLLRAGIEEWLSSPKSNFTQAAEYIAILNHS